MTKSNDNQTADQRTDRKASAASADDEAMFEVTPFGRRRKPTQGRALMSWIVHIIGFPFFYIHKQMKDRRRTREQKWSDDRGHHGVEPNSAAADSAPRGG